MGRVRVVKRMNSVRLLEGTPLTFLDAARLSRDLSKAFLDNRFGDFFARGIFGTNAPPRAHAARRGFRHPNRRGTPQGPALPPSALRAPPPVVVRCTA